MANLKFKRILNDNTNAITYVIRKYQNNWATVKIYQKYSGCYTLVGTRLVKC
jgi:hypothetical protein